MSKRVTVMMDDENDKKLHLLQAKEIQKRQSSYSYSRALNEVLKEVL